VDIISSAPDKNVTETNYFEIDEIFGEVEGVERVDHFIRWRVELRSPEINGTVEAILLALPDDSSLYGGMSVDGPLEDGVRSSDPLTLRFETYMPFNPPGFEFRHRNYTVAGSVALDERTYTISVGRYNIYLRDLIQSSESLSRRPRYNMILMTEDTLEEILDPIFAEMRRPVDDQTTQALIMLDRDTLINQWDIDGSMNRLQGIFDDINTEGAEYMYTPRSYLQEILITVSQLSNQMKTSTILVALPVFFCAWYLGMTVSDVVFNLRRREIGLLFTRGMTHRQVLYILVFEGLIVSALAAVVGVLAGAAVLVIVIPEMGFLKVLNSVSPLTMGATLLFSTALALTAVYRPAQEATRINIVDALREHVTEEEGVGEWQTALVAFLLGAYKIGMLFLGLRAYQRQPDSHVAVLHVVGDGLSAELHRPNTAVLGLHQAVSEVRARLPYGAGRVGVPRRRRRGQVLGHKLGEEPEEGRSFDLHGGAHNELQRLRGR